LPLFNLIGSFSPVIYYRAKVGFARTFVIVGTDALIHPSFPVFLLEGVRG
jgi:hypothetical protein